jgi:excinuclease UvrABC nuclease subunit
MKTISLAEINFWKQIPESRGVYFIYSCNNLIPIRLNRVLGTDEEGVLYIGKSENLRKIKNALEGTQPKTKSNTTYLWDKI